MMMPENNFLSAIRSFQPQLGTWNMINTPMVSEMVSSAGFDWAVIDMEHAPNEVENAMHQLQAFAAYQTAAVVRPPTTEPVVTKRLMDVGAPNLLFPMVDTAEEAAAAVASMRYPGRGIRGVAGVHRGNRFGRVTDYLEKVEDQTGVIVQAESVTAMQNLENIAAVDGVDGIFFGPADLSASLGMGGDTSKPEVWAAVEEGAARVRAARKPAGTLVGSVEKAKDLFAKGLTFVAVGTDMGLLARSLDSIVIDIKGEGTEWSESSY